MSLIVKKNYIINQSKIIARMNFKIVILKVNKHIIHVQLNFKANLTLVILYRKLEIISQMCQCPNANSAHQKQSNTIRPFLASHTTTHNHRLTSRASRHQQKEIDNMKKP